MGFFKKIFKLPKLEFTKEEKARQHILRLLSKPPLLYQFFYPMSGKQEWRIRKREEEEDRIYELENAKAGNEIFISKQGQLHRIRIIDESGKSKKIWVKSDDYLKKLFKTRSLLTNKPQHKKLMQEIDIEILKSLRENEII